MAMSAHVPVPVPPRKPGRIAGAETRNGVPPVALELCLRAPENFGYVYTRAERRNHTGVCGLVELEAHDSDHCD